jgi:uncharacterized protein (DUF1800 family)
VTWTITGTSTAEYYGTISAAGLYTPPQSVPVHPIITITATSQTDVTKSSSISVTISNPVPVITAANLTPAAKGTFLVDVLGSNFMPASQVMDVYGVPTSFISATHLQFTLTAPPAAGTVVPISVVTPAPGRTQSANFSMVIPGAPAVVVTGSNTATIGTPVQYTAAVSGVANTAVTWSIVGTLATENYGTISQTGLYTPPPAAPVHGQISIVATSQAVTTTSGSVSVLLTNPTPVITSATLTAEYHSTFLVDVYGTGFMPSSAVLYLGYGWATTYVSPTHLQFTLTNPPAAGTVEALGVVTPAPGRTQSANFNVTIPGLIGVTVTGAAQSTVGIPVQLTANVTGTTNTAVNWSVNNTVGGSSTYGTISASGLYTPPSVVPPNNVVTILATSQQDATKTGSTTVTLSNVVPTITSATTSALANHQILVTVTGTNFIPSSSVQFQGYGLPTTYISPTSITGTITTAQTAGADVSIAVVNPAPGKTTSASYTVQLPGQVGVTVVGAGIVAVGSTAEYAATLTGTTNTAVNWSVSAANGAEAGSISSTGVYTPPTSISANLPVTITATSQVEPSSTGSLTVTLVSVPAAAAARLLEQSTFGPTDALIAHVQTIGLSAFIDEQLALPPSLIPLVPATLPARCTGNAPICIDEDWWNNAINAPDQLRQRVANALGEQFVISYREANGAFVPPYVNMLVTDAFGNWSTIMKDVTLSPGMGEYLNMVNSGKPPAGQIANENFARENMQLFNLGTNLLNQDGTLQTDSSGNPIPAYTEAQVEAFSRVFTGWTWAAPNGGATPFPNWNADPSVPMVAIESAHDTTSKVLLNTTLPAGQTAEQDLAGAIQDVFNHPNVGPFVAVRLIQHLVKSNPTPAYVGRIAAVFANDGTGVRGNMAAVVKAILLDPEARAGDTNPVVTDGYMREPLLWTANVLRALNATPKPGVTDDSAYNALDTFPASQGETIFGSPTVFNFYPPQFGLMDTGLNAPQFALETSATIMQKLTLASNIVNNLVGALSVNLSATSPLGVLAASGDGLLLDELNTLFMHGQMSSSMRTAIENVISQTTDPAQKVRMAVYLVITSTQYKIIH